MNQIIILILNLFKGVAKRKGEESNWHNSELAEAEAVKIDEPAAALVQPALVQHLWSYPVAILRVTSPFGWRILPGQTKRQFHNGVDYTGHNTVALAVTDAIVKKIVMPDTQYPVKFKWDNRLNKFIPISGIPAGRAWTPYVVLECAFDSSIQFVYRHVKAKVSPGEQVTAGQIIAEIGNYGYSMGAHLHFEVVKSEKEIDPVPFLKSKVK